MNLDALPKVADAALSFAIPAEVRRAGTQATTAFKAALSFETMLVSQLVKEMTPKTGALAEGPYASTVQETLSTALVGGHGLGLAQQLYKEMR